MSYIVWSVTGCLNIILFLFLNGYFQKSGCFGDVMSATVTWDFVHTLLLLYSGARSHTCGVLLMFLVLCCVWFVYPILCWYRCPEIGTSSIDRAQLRRFRLKTETIQFRKRCVLNKNRSMGNVKKHNSCSIAID